MARHSCFRSSFRFAANSYEGELRVEREPTLMVAEWCNPFMGKAITEEQLYLIARQMFNLVKLFSLNYKHDGFQEEREWCIIYMPDRDPLGVLKERIGYFIGSRGVEPKLKLKIEPLPLEPRDTWTFATILTGSFLAQAYHHLWREVVWCGCSRQWVKPNSFRRWFHRLFRYGPFKQLDFLTVELAAPTLRNASGDSVRWRSRRR
jgi:hypothetical protein